MFITTFVNYAFAHWTRKCYTNVTAQLMESGVTKETLAAMASGIHTRLAHKHIHNTYACMHTRAGSVCQAGSDYF